MRIDFKSFVIANGGTTSGEVQVGEGRIAAVVLPATMTGNFKLQASRTPGGTYGDVHDGSGPMLFSSGAAGTWITAVDVGTTGQAALAELCAGLPYIRFVSSGAEGAERTGYVAIVRTPV